MRSVPLFAGFSSIARFSARRTLRQPLFVIAMVWLALFLGTFFRTVPRTIQTLAVSAFSVGMALGCLALAAPTTGGVTRFRRVLSAGLSGRRLATMVACYVTLVIGATFTLGIVIVSLLQLLVPAMDFFPLPPRVEALGLSLLSLAMIAIHCGCLFGTTCVLLATSCRTLQGQMARILLIVCPWFAVITILDSEAPAWTAFTAVTMGSLTWLSSAATLERLLRRL